MVAENRSLGAKRVHNADVGLTGGGAEKRAGDIEVAGHQREGAGVIATETV